MKVDVLAILFTAHNKSICEGETLTRKYQRDGSEAICHDRDVIVII